MSNANHPTNGALVTIPWTETHVIRAKAVDQDYQISISLPAGYYEDTEKRYPTIYVLDGHWYFGMVVDMVRIMNLRFSFCNELPDVVIVGIAYPEGVTLTERLHEVGHRRMRDYMPESKPAFDAWVASEFPVSAPKQSGGGAAFREFLGRELIPWVERRYRADTIQRCLVGHSLGGQFALYTLFTQPTLFQRYLIASPAPWFADEKWFVDHVGALSASVYLSEGELEGADVGYDVIYPSLKCLLAEKLAGTGSFVEQTFAKQTHCAVVAPSFQAGLVALLGTP